MKVCVIGSGYVGLTTAAGLASFGHKVTATSRDPEKIARIIRGNLPLYEPGLAYLITEGVGNNTLHFSLLTPACINEAEAIFIAVGTPQQSDGSADLSQLLDCVNQICCALDNNYHLIIIKSTVPVGTCDKVTYLIKTMAPNAHFDLVSNPEFLREGSAVYDMLNPDRIVVGATSSKAKELMGVLYAKFRNISYFCDNRSAEMIKYASNAFLAMKISFANQMSDACEALGANIKDVMTGCGLDRRIGKEFLNAGLGFGGSCFPKDVAALYAMGQAHQLDLSLLGMTLTINAQRIDRACQKITTLLPGHPSGRKVGILGLSFKPNTDDIRASQALALCARLLAQGYAVVAHDPKASKVKCLELLPELVFADSLESVFYQAELCVLATEWEDYLHANYSALYPLMASPTILDTRNILNAKSLEKIGYKYYNFSTQIVLEGTGETLELSQRIG